MSLLKLIGNDQQAEREWQASLHGREIKRHGHGVVRLPRQEDHMAGMIARRKRGH